MDTATVLLSQYIRQMGIQLTVISRHTGIPYGQLWASLAHQGTRKLRANEFLAICAFLTKDPMDFYTPNTPHDQAS